MSFARSFAVVLSLALLSAGVAAPASGAVTGASRIAARSGLRAGVLPMRGHALRRDAAPASTPPAPHLNYYGGPVESNTQVASVLWGGSPSSYLPEVAGSTTPNMDGFLGQVLNSGYLRWLNEYHTSSQVIGTGSFLGRSLIAPSSAANGSTIDDSAIQTELVDQIIGGNLPAPTFDAHGNTNTVYALFFPAGTTVCMGSDCSGQVFCAYHSTVQTTIDGVSRYLPYMVLPDDSDANMQNGCGSASATTAFQIMQGYTSHELAETVTDPAVGLATQFSAPLSWYDQYWGEIADICQEVLSDPNGTLVGVDHVTYTVQKEWNNHQGACVTGDTTPPAVTMTAPAARFQLSTTLTPSYTATDAGTGVASYDVAYRVASWNGGYGAYTALTTQHLTGSPGHEYCFHVRAYDYAGNVSAWTPDKCTSIPLDDRSLATATSGWTRLASTADFARTVSKTTTNGAKLQLANAQVARIALVVTTCSTCGSVAIYLGSTLWKTVSTTTSATHYQVIELPGSFSERTATVVLKDVTAGKQVLIDGLGIARD
jgi:hypothetical protein